MLFLLLFLLISLASAVEVKFNYSPARNSLSELGARELKLVAEEIRGIKGVRCEEKVCEVELFPLLVDYRLKGFSPFSLIQVEKYLGLKPYYRYSQRRLASAVENVTFFLKNRGYWDASVKSTLFVSKEGLATLEIRAHEGPLYLWGGFDFLGNPCFSPDRFYRSFRKPFGSPLSPLELYNALDLAQTLCRKRGNFRSFVYYEEPPRVERENLLHFARKNLREDPFLFINFLASYLDMLVESPVAGLKFLLSKQYAVYPKMVVKMEGNPLKLEIEGAKAIPKRVLLKEIKRFIGEMPFFSVLKLQDFLINFYRRRGFFDVRVEIVRDENRLTIKIYEGPRYRLEVKVKPPLPIKLPKDSLYSLQEEKKLLKAVEDYLRRNRYLYDSVKVYKAIDRKNRTVVLTVFVVNPRKVKIVQSFQIEVTDKNLKEYLREKLESVDPYRLLTERGYLQKVKNALYNTLISFGCQSPEVSFKKEERAGVVKIIWVVRCPSVKEFGKTVFWIEGRLRPEELKYMIRNFEGKRFKRRYLALLEKRLKETDLFETISVRTVNDEKIYPLVEGVEKRPFGVEGMVGFSSDEGAMADLSLKVRDPFGWGSLFTLRYKISQKVNLYNFGYLDAYLFSPRLFGGFNLFKRYEEHRDFAVTFKGFSLTAGFHANIYTDLALTLVSNSYRLEGDGDGYIRKLVASARFYYPLAFPYRGLLYARLDLSAALQGANYAKAEGWLDYALIKPSFYGSVKLSAGAVSPSAPIFEKFYLGGIKDLKGYSYEGVAPAGGGDIFWYLGTEIGIPLFKPLYLFGGLDLGNSVKKGQNPFKEFKKDIFAGVGGITTAGPIRFIVALPLEGKVTFSNIKYLFLVGFNF